MKLKTFGRVSLLLLVMAAGFAFGHFGLGKGLEDMGVAMQKPPKRPVQNQLPALQGAPTSPETVPEITPNIPLLPGEKRKDPDPAQKPATAENQPDEPDNNPPVVEPKPADEGDAGAVRYSLQVGTYESEDGAQEQADSLTGLGYAARVEAQEDEKTFRVLVGSYTSEKSARKIAEELREKGFDAWITQ
jgi:cell division protein FtsN